MAMGPEVAYVSIYLAAEDSTDCTRGSRAVGSPRPVSGEGSGVAQLCGLSVSRWGGGGADHVMTVGSLRPVYSFNLLMVRAMSTRGASASWRQNNQTSSVTDQTADVITS